MAADPERYASLEQVKYDLGIMTADQDTDEALTIALDAASEEAERLTDPDPEATEVSPRLNLLVRRLTARWWQRKDSPLGIMGGFTDVPIYVRGTDPDIDQLINSLQHSWGLA
jgi:hypothetical protein